MNEMKMDADTAHGRMNLGTVQKDVEKLRQDLKMLESQLAALSPSGSNKTPVASKNVEVPHPTEKKGMRCKSCKHLRLPHKSNPHYFCQMQNIIVDSKLTCGLHTQNERCKINSIGDTQ